MTEAVKMPQLTRFFEREYNPPLLSDRLSLSA